MRASRRNTASFFACLLLSSGCIEDRLNVDITTRIFADGSCSRRIEYRLVRVDSANNKALEILPAEDPLRLLHRFPRGEPWAVTDDARADQHTVEVEATLPSPDAIEGDYWRSGRKRGVPARNAVSFAREEGEPAAAAYAYAETFRDPASPLEGMRALAQELLRRDDDFAERLLRALGSSPLQKGEVRKAYKRDFAEPFGREVARLAERPVWGPRERKELDDIWERFDALQRELAATLALLSAGLPADTLAAALDEVQESMGKELQRDLERAGLPLLSEKDSTSAIHFRATLVLPGTIVRANTCAEGDTATWEFDQDDLYGRGFEMWARSVSR